MTMFSKTVNTNRKFRLLTKFCFGSVPKMASFEIPMTSNSCIFYCSGFPQKCKNFVKSADTTTESCENTKKLDLHYSAWYACNIHHFSINLHTQRKFGLLAKLYLNRVSKTLNLEVFMTKAPSIFIEFDFTKNCKIWQNPEFCMILAPATNTWQEIQNFRKNMFFSLFWPFFSKLDF